jgi:ADP-heptose:LPS heptosyltransferase
LKKVLIIQTAFIGDVILSTPLIKELSIKFPEIKIDYLVRKGNESLLNNQPNLNNIYKLDKSKGKIGQLFNFIKIFRVNKYDEIINLHRYASTGFITVFSTAKNTVGFDKNPLSFLYKRKIKHTIGDGEHEVERNLKLIAHHNIPSFSNPVLYPSKEDYEKVSEYKNVDYFCIAPSSVWYTKQLPVEKWIELSNKLPENHSIYLLGGGNDIPLCEKIKTSSKNNKIKILAGKISFLQSAALMKDAKMNFVNDSGPLHICSAMNAPVKTFFCSTSPLFGFGPTHPNGEIIESQEKLDCKPCGLHGHKACPKVHFKCGYSINIDKVIGKW